MKEIIFFILFVMLVGCSAKPWEKAAHKYEQSASLMNTTVTIDVCAQASQEQNLDAAFKEAWDRLADIGWRMNVFDEKSDVAKVNNSFGCPVAIGQDTYAVIKMAMEYNRLTDGAFDITVWPLISLWKSGEKTNTLPSHVEIMRTKKFLGPAVVQFLPDHQLTLVNEVVKIDLGGIAAGYAVDETVDILRRHGFTDFLIDLGGDMYAGGHNCQGKLWKIGIKDPRDITKIFDVVFLSNAAVTTSGDYEKFYEIKGQRWSHIFNPLTGYPQKGVTSATVIAPTTIAADALATALCVLGRERGQRLIDHLGEGYAALIIDSPDGKAITPRVSAAYHSFKEDSKDQ